MSIVTVRSVDGVNEYHTLWEFGVQAQLGIRSSASVVASLVSAVSANAAESMTTALPQASFGGGVAPVTVAVTSATRQMARDGKRIGSSVAICCRRVVS